MYTFVHIEYFFFTSDLEVICIFTHDDGNR